MTSKTRSTLKTGSEIARLLVVTKQAVSEWANDGCPYHLRRNSTRRLFALDEVMRWRADVAAKRVKRHYPLSPSGS